MRDPGSRRLHFVGKPRSENARLVGGSRPASGLCHPLLVTGGTGQLLGLAVWASGLGTRGHFLSPDSGHFHPSQGRPASVMAKVRGQQLAGSWALPSILFSEEV